jgi:hypothetical protein
MYKATSSHTLKHRYNSKRGEYFRRFTNFLQLADIPNVTFCSDQVSVHLSCSVIPQIAASLILMRL